MTTEHEAQTEQEWSKKPDRGTLARRLYDMSDREVEEIFGEIGREGRR